jgi:hypothetical protein
LLQTLQSYMEIDSALLVNFETPRNLNLGDSPKVPPPLWLGMKYGRFIDQSIRPLSVTNCSNGMSNFCACTHWLFRSAFDQCNFHLRRIWSLLWTSITYTGTMVETSNKFWSFQFRDSLNGSFGSDSSTIFEIQERMS